MLSARNLHKTYGTRKILDGVDIDIAPGEITCAIGPSGTGKQHFCACCVILNSLIKAASW